MAGFVRYKSYSFVNKDPIIDAFRTLRANSGVTATQIQEGGGPRGGTIHGWEKGNVKRPQFASIMAAARTCGAIGIKFDSQGRPHFISRANGTKR